jgi:transposase InsO family protein
MQLEKNWLSLYPRPMQYIHDQGGTFIGTDFTRIIEEDNGIPLVPTSTVKNRQVNAICERIHQTIENTLRTMPLDFMHANDLIDSVSATTMFASRVLPYRSLMDNTPGALAFHRDMLLDIPLIADLITIRNSRQRIINERLRLVDLHRLNHDYLSRRTSITQGLCAQETRRSMA